jgi:hypothetical protein
MSYESIDGQNAIDGHNVGVRTVNMGLHGKIGSGGFPLTPLSSGIPIDRC